jgi:MFS family permease
MHLFWKGTAMAWQSYHTVWLLFSLGWICNLLVRVHLGPLLPLLIETWGITHAEAGLLAGAYFYAYMAMQFPAGVLGDRFGKKRVLVFGFLWAALCTLASGLATGFAMLLTLRLLAGLGAGMFFSNDRALIAAITPPERMATGQGLSFVGVGVGLSLGLFVPGLVAEHLGWRAVFPIIAFPTLAVGAAMLLWVRSPASAPTQGWPAPRQIGQLVKRADLWALYLGGIAVIYTLYCVVTWAPAIVAEVGVTGVGAAAQVASILGVAGIPGIMFTGWWSDRRVQAGHGRIGVLIIAFALLAFLTAALGVAVQLSASVWLIFVLLFGVGFVVWGVWSPLYALIPEMTPSTGQATTFGLANTIWFSGALLSPWLTGKLKDLTGSFAWGLYVAAGLQLIGMVLLRGQRAARQAPVREAKRR